MDYQHYYIPKSTRTLSDALLAFGVATVLQELLQRHAPQAEVILRDAGSYYAIDTGVPIQEAWLADAHQHIPFVTDERRHKVPEDLEFAAARSVDETWETFRRFLEQQEQLRQQVEADDAAAQALADLAPEPDWTIVTYLGDYRMQAQHIHNGLVEQWLRTGQQFPGLNMRTVLELFSSPTADWDAIAADWKKAVKESDFKNKDTVTASQLFNPHMGKGQNQPKANKLSMGNEKLFWLLEYLKAVGLWAAAVPTRATNADLRKTYVLAPRELRMRYHRRVFSRFRERLRNEGAIKQDIVTVLLYTEVLLEQSLEDDALDIFDDGRVTDVVNGMEVATYQLLSANSYTVMNLAFLGLPDWMPHIRTSEDARTYIALLQEHRERIRAIDEDRSEGYALLQAYRDFVAGNDLKPFFSFLAGYSQYLMSALDRKNYYVRPFSEFHLRRLFDMTTPELSPILADEGFRNVAYAIRMSTVTPVYLDRNQRRFEVRYGLGQDLLRKAQYPDDFIQALSEFIQSYNDETLRVHERTKGAARRRLVTTQDIESVVRLVDTYGSKTVCNLLVAFGYARDPRVKPEEELGTATPEGEVAQA